jgi:hypothetical protein
MYCWEDTNSFSNFSYTLTDTRYVLLERHEQHQKLLQRVGEVADAFHVFPTVLIECQLGCTTSC